MTAMLLIAALVAGCSSSPNSPREPVGMAPASDPAGSTPARSVPTAPPARSSPRQLAISAAEKLLSLAPTVPGSQRAEHPPVPALSHPMIMSGGNLIDRAGWWTAPGSVHAALAYLRTHVPNGVSEQGRSLATGPNQVAGIFFAASGPAWNSLDLYSLQLEISANQLNHRVGIRVDTQAEWLQRRTAAETIPADVTSVDVAVIRPQRAPTVRRTLGPATARQLARVINRLPVSYGGPRSCPIDFGATDRLTFPSPHGIIVVSVDVRGCQGAAVSADGAAQPGLSGGSKVDRPVLTALHLPLDYGQPH